MLERWMKDEVEDCLEEDAAAIVVVVKILFPEEITNPIPVGLSSQQRHGGM